MKTPLTQGAITDPKLALAFILAGKATVTFRSISSGSRFTYKIKAAPKRNENDAQTWFVSLLNGPDNTTDYIYIGIIRNNEYIWTSKARVGKQTPSVLGFDFVLKSLVKNSMRGFEVWHEGKCGRCGRPLTVPESIAQGFGPECIHLVGGAPMVFAAAVGGQAAPQANLDFGGNVVTGTSKTKIGGYAATQALYSRPAVVPQTEHSVEVEIDRRVKLYAAMSPEEYNQDGILTDEEAYKITYNRIKNELLKGGK